MTIMTSMFSMRKAEMEDVQDAVIGILLVLLEAITSFSGNSGEVKSQEFLADRVRQGTLHSITRTYGTYTRWCSRQDEVAVL